MHLVVFPPTGRNGRANSQGVVAPAATRRIDLAVVGETVSPRPVAAASLRGTRHTRAPLARGCAFGRAGPPGAVGLLGPAPTGPPWVAVLCWFCRMIAGNRTLWQCDCGLFSPIEHLTSFAACAARRGQPVPSLTPESYLCLPPSSPLLPSCWSPRSSLDTPSPIYPSLSSDLLCAGSP